MSLGRFLLRTAATFGVLLVVVVLVLSLIRIPVNLNNYRGTVASAASSALGRTVSVDGDITVTTSLWPYFEIQTLRIANPAGFEDGDLAGWASRA